MNASPAQRAKAVYAIARTMADLHESAPESLPDDLQIAWNSLERVALDLADGADFDHYEAYTTVLETRSHRLLNVLPDRPEKNRSCWAFDEAVLERVLGWITPAHMALALRKELMPTRATRMLIEHAPGDPEWDALILGPFSQAALGSAAARDRRDFLSAHSVSRVHNLERLYAYARAQARDHPDLLREHLELRLRYRIDRVGNGSKTPYALHSAFILAAAGVSTSGLEALIEDRIADAYPGASRHETLRLLALTRDLEAAITEARSLKKD